MSLLINIALLGLSFLGALAAFGGETWKKGDEPLLQRVTHRGWASITFLCLALLLGIVKEIRNNRATGGLAAQVETLQGQLKQAHALVRSQRLEELSQKIGRISDYENTLSSVQAVFERYRSISLAINGRKAKEGFPAPAVLKFSFASKNFRFDVCSAAFATAAGREFKDADCTVASLGALVRDIPNASFEEGALGASAVALLTYLAEISVAHRNALNPANSPGQSAPLLSLESLLAQIPSECGVRRAEAAWLASVLRAVETSSQQLHASFVWAFPARPEVKNDQERKFLGAATVFAFQMGKLDQILGAREQPDPNFMQFGRFVENVASGYKRLTSDVGEVLKGCKSRREQLTDEKSAIEKGQ